MILADSVVSKYPESPVLFSGNGSGLNQILGNSQNPFPEYYPLPSPSDLGGVELIKSGVLREVVLTLLAAIFLGLCCLYTRILEADCSTYVPPRSATYGSISAVTHVGDKAS